ncbi:MAG TPA: PEGA domain-containing protein [Polyangiales bacterium]|nr:PEGA domain-containing protein [Polyangiales bacterium]
MMRSAIVFLLLFTSANAWAQSAEDLERAKASWRAGAVAYTAGEYAPAIQAFEAAYALTPLSPLAFSLAQAYRRQYFVARDRSHLERAVELFKRYVQEVPQGGRSADALDALSQLEPLLATQPSAEPIAVVEARPTRLMITADAAEARISLDSGPPLASPAIHEVTPGPHRVRVEASGFTPSERVVTALPGELILSEITLRELPASLQVASSSSAELYVDGSFVGHGGPQSTFALPSGPHTVTLTQPGHRIAQRAVVLERGATLAVELPAEVTFQRKVARALFAVGGAGVVAGAVFGALAMHHQRDAQAFLRDQRRGNVSDAEADDYDADVRRRNRLRLATGLSLSAAGVIFVAALVTHQLDRPNFGEVQRVHLSADGLVVKF